MKEAIDMDRSATTPGERRRDDYHEQAQAAIARPGLIMPVEKAALLVEYAIDAQCALDRDGGSR